MGARKWLLVFLVVEIYARTSEKHKPPNVCSDKSRRSSSTIDDDRSELMQLATTKRKVETPIADLPQANPSRVLPARTALVASDAPSRRSKVRLSGVQRAHLWRRCPAWAKSKRHCTDIVASRSKNFVYFDNVKAASSSIRFLFSHVLHIKWNQTDLPLHSNLSALGRTSSDGLIIDDIRSLFKFSVVRNPVEKFESGVRQAWAQDESLRDKTADELLDLQLQKIEKWNVTGGSVWINEHFMPSSWRLSAYVEHQPVDLDFIGSVETISEDWPAIVQSFTGLSGSEMEALTDLHAQNSRSDDDLLSKLSAQSIKRMCRSAMYMHDWECFGYEMPRECE
eukprot:TRINITY_DN8362_c1_g1_i1.p1 TRINITY_DN8362_c1_g1~~TRINITY_DN8362_c1_g1_i1.p1  ORF type:complete len:338 (-),score=26.81 TRINITY_DN8362_c1_g1_i1:302-1315(-)